MFDKFVSVPYRVLHLDGLSLSDGLVYGYLNEFARGNKERIVWESSRNMANKLNISPTTITECISHLESVGLIQVQRKQGKPNVYKVLHDLKDSEDTFGLEETDSSEEDSELDGLPDYVKEAVLGWRNGTADSRPTQKTVEKETSKSQYPPFPGYEPEKDWSLGIEDDDIDF